MGRTFIAKSHMNYALFNKNRHEAAPGLSGECPSCLGPVLAKCGEIKVWHWAHFGKRHCDPWWENETEWHRGWKRHFPVTWQEVIHIDSNGEKHTADVKTDQGWILEFQHSYLNPEERRSRDNFYAKLIWVVDGMRLKRGKTQFFNAWKNGITIGKTQSVRQIFSEDCGLLREWTATDKSVFFDFGDEQLLWWLLPKPSDRRNYVAAFSRNEFIKTHLHSSTHTFESHLKNFDNFVSYYNSRIQIPVPNRVGGFQQYLARRRKFQKRF